MKDQAQQSEQDEAYERFTALLVKNQPVIMGFIRALVPNADSAEDVLQKTCLIAWQKFDGFDPATQFSTWACQIALFEVKNYQRRASRDRHVFSDEVLDLLAAEVPGEVDRLGAETAALSECVEQLNTQERDLLGRCYQQGTTVRQVAQSLERSANSVYKQLNRIRRRLLVCITLRLEQMDQGGAL